MKKYGDKRVPLPGIAFNLKQGRLKIVISNTAENVRVKHRHPFDE